MNDLILATEYSQAIWQVTELGYRVDDVSNRLQVSKNSLYKWAKTAQAEIERERSDSAIATKRHSQRLQAELHRLEVLRKALTLAAANAVRANAAISATPSAGN